MITEERWLCYNCIDDLHDECVGVPCMCDCPDPNADRINLTTEKKIEELDY